MPKRASRTTGDETVDAAIREILDALGPGTNRHLVAECLATVARLAMEDHDKLDLKITSAALAEMRRAFGVFRPYRDKQKITMSVVIPKQNMSCRRSGKPATSIARYWASASSSVSQRRRRPG